jgi:hypothetical protein
VWNYKITLPKEKRKIFMKKNIDDQDGYGYDIIVREEPKKSFQEISKDCVIGSQYCSGQSTQCQCDKIWKNQYSKEEPKQLFTKGDKVLFSGQMLNENVIDKLVTIFYTLGRGELNDMSDIMDEYTHIYRVWNKDLKHILKKEPKQERERGITITHVGKQETLEEVAKKYYPPYPDGIITSEIYSLREGFVKGIKVQQERSYSEEDMIQFAQIYLSKRHDNPRMSNKDIFNLWLEQFKKKKL